MSMIEVEIGYVENAVKNKVEIWFYKRLAGRWLRVQREVLTVNEREMFLNKLIRKGATLVPLGRA